MQKPSQKPHYPFFSSGPCAKPPGWSFDKLKGAALSRSHRSKPAVAKLQEVIDKSRSLLQIPDDYFCLLYTSPSPRDVEESRMPSSA